MPKKNSYITVTDQFCGAGGSSQGAFAAGCEVKMTKTFCSDYAVLKSGKYQVLKLGNAAMPAAMKWLVQQVVASLQ